jgi:anaerobic selenocysteine-containing dehydrogenase
MTQPSSRTTSRTTFRICPLCEACCGLEVCTEGPRVTGIRGDAADVFSAGYLCPKGVALKELHDDPDRLRTPLIRRGGRLVEAGWDEAFAEVQQRLLPLLQQHGRDAVGVTLGNPSAHKMGLFLYGARLIRALGTKNVFTASTLDQLPKQLSVGLMFGHWMSVPVPDIERCEFLLMLGANPMASNGSLWTVPDFRGKARALRGRGGRLVVVDPRRTETAAIADRHLFIRPGTDVFLLLGLVHTFFDEGLLRLRALAPHVAGLDALRDAVAPFAPERTAAHCGIDAATQRELARTLATTAHAAVYGRIGTCTQAYGSLCSWLVDVLNVLGGHLDHPGGAMFPQAPAFAANTRGRPGSGPGITTGRRRSRVSGAPEVLGELPMTCLAEEIETPDDAACGPGRVRALITIASNPALSAPNGPRLSQALASLEFMLSLDIYLNETTRHAHVILPGLSPLEESHYDVVFPQFSYRNHARYSAPVLAPPAGHLPEWQVLTRLAGIVQGHAASADVQALDDAAVADEVRRSAGAAADAVLAAVSRWQGPERLLDLALRAGPYGDQFGERPGGLTLAQLLEQPHGIDLGALAPRIPEVLRTPSGRIELAPPLLVDDLARVRAALERDVQVPDLVVIGRRDVRSNNSWLHNLPLLAKGPDRSRAIVHPADAVRLGLTEGSHAVLTGPQGHRVTVQVSLSDEVMQGVVCLPHGWGHDQEGTRLGVAAQRPGANLNALLDDRLRDPLSGNAVLSGVPVQVEAVR